MGEATLAELWDDFCGQKDFEDPHPVPAAAAIYALWLRWREQSPRRSGDFSSRRI